MMISVAEYRFESQLANMEIESLPKSMTPGGLWLVVRRDAGPSHSAEVSTSTPSNTSVVAGAG
jgi:hypothetical protein